MTDERKAHATLEIRKLLESQPATGYANTVKWVAKFRDASTELAAAVYEPQFNREFKRLPMDTYAAMSTSFRFLNNELKQLGFGVVSPANGQPAVLRCGPKDRLKTTGYGWLESPGKYMKGSYYGLQESDFGGLTLTGLPRREEPLEKIWTDKIGAPEKRGKGR